MVGHKNQKYKDKEHMKIQRKKGTQSPSTIPLNPKVEREEKGRNALTDKKDSIQNLHVCRKR
jgi:hypothetical protein